MGRTSMRAAAAAATLAHRPGPDGARASDATTPGSAR
jgi:hypothetical protein